MLFNLQAVEQRVTQQKDEIQNISSRPVSDHQIQIENPDNDEVQKTLQVHYQNISEFENEFYQTD